MGRPRKYANDAERNRAWAKAHRAVINAGRRAKRRNQGIRLLRLTNDFVADPRPALELLMERDFRLSLGQGSGGPPEPYQGAYYVTAWRFQRKFARELGT